MLGRASLRDGHSASTADHLGERNPQLCLLGLSEKSLGNTANSSSLLLVREDSEQFSGCT